ncbi:hypothetical protein WN51_01969 [Melipona quadrifasciata]|uniref:Uncharacterized protein n=1 Tax=Melipona quadrifasciata TaxID=166423 RepID=A0A0N0BKJ2_9HYME|nr:hypothetical protein WN51_01969 [Melipona quadrifasciata]
MIPPICLRRTADENLCYSNNLHNHDNNTTKRFKIQNHQNTIPRQKLPQMSKKWPETKNSKAEKKKEKANQAELESRWKSQRGFSVLRVFESCTCDYRRSVSFIEFNLCSKSMLLVTPVVKSLMRDRKKKVFKSITLCDIRNSVKNKHILSGYFRSFLRFGCEVDVPGRTETLLGYKKKIPVYSLKGPEIWALFE